MKLTFRRSAALATWSALCLAVPAQDFVNYRGTTGNGIYPGVGLLKEWPKEGPKLLWTFNPGDGWASPSVVDGKVYVVGSRIDQGSTFLLKKGRHGLLIQAAVGRPWNDWGKIFMTPHLIDVEQKTREALAQYAEDKVFWAEYARTRDERIVLRH